MRREIKIGLTVLTALVLFYLSLTWASRSHLFAGDRIDYSAEFSHVSGLLVGDPVHIRGYTMGRVTSIFPQAQTVAVGIQLDRDFPIFEGAYAEIQPKELMGGKQIEIIQGAGNKRIENATPIPGKASLDFSSAFSQMGSILNQVDNNRIERLTLRMDSIFGSLQQILSTENVQSITQTISLVESSLGRINRLSKTVEEKKLVERVDTLMEVLTATIASAEKPIRSIDKLSIQVDSLVLPRLISNLDSLSQFMDQLSSLAYTGKDILESEDTFVGKMTQDPSFPGKIDTVLVQLNRVLRQIQEEKIIVGFKRRKK